jgi:hypothetical protein
MNARWAPDALDELLHDYVMNANPKSNEDLTRYLRRYPQFREVIIDFTATWRAIEKVLPPPRDLVGEEELMRHAETRLRASRRCRSERKSWTTSRE